MSVSDSEHFLNVIDQSHLLNDEQLARVQRRVEDVREPVEPLRLAYILAQGGYVTVWQARRLLAGRTNFYLGRYKLLSRIDKGGMGTVFKAQHALMDRIVALKVMSRALLSSSRATARFTREVKAAAALNHPNIITAYDADCVGSTHFLVMEYVDGRDLNFWLRHLGPFPPALACECIMQAAKGLAHAHHQKMVHRDIKPVNLLVAWSTETNRPVIKILDMGLARFKSETSEDGGLTRAGTIVGTPDYIAPEAAENFKSADIRADIFSLGCALFKLLTGQLPFKGDNTMAKLMARTRRDAPLASSLRPETPKELDEIVAKMLARSPKLRYQTPADVAEALAPFAASTLGDQDALELLKELPAPDSGDSIMRIEPDADTSLDECYEDLSDAPLRDEGAQARAGDRADQADGEELGFAPLEREPTPRAFTAQGSAPPSTQNSAQTKPPPADEALAPLETEPEPQADLVEDWLREGEKEADLLRRSRGIFGALFGHRPRGARRNVWDSPLLILGGGMLLLFILIGALLLWTLNRGTGDRALRFADDDFDSGSYGQAIHKYDEYLRRYPNHVRVSHARVRRGLARLLQAVDIGRSWPDALQTAQDVIEEISTEAAFGEARADLGALLLKTAEGLAAQAAEEQRRELVDQTRTALGLFDKYAPGPQKREQPIREIELSLEMTTRKLQQDVALAEAVEAMKTAAQRGATQEAYATGQALLKNYPNLANHPDLNEALLAVAQAQRGAVEVDETAKAALTVEAQRVVQNTVVLSSRRDSGSVELSRQHVFALAQGAAYGLNASDGRVLWRRFVGFDTQFVPRTVSDAAGADAVLIDSSRNEIVRVAAATGELDWRQPLEDRIVGLPMVGRERLVVSTQSGQLVTLDLESGAITRTVKLPQELSIGPAADAYLRNAYQLAHHSNIFVLSMDDGTPQQVYHVGHERGTATVAPLVVERYLILTENHRLHDCRIRVFLLDESGQIDRQLQSVALEGQMHVSPVVSGEYLHAVTDLKAMYSFRISPPGEAEPLTLLASTLPTGDRHTVRFFAGRGNRVWVAGTRLSEFGVEFSRARFTPKWSEHPGDVFLQPLELIDDVLIQVRRRAEGTGVTVAATNLADGATLWEANLAMRAARGTSHAVVDQRLLTLTADGALFAVGFEQLTGRPAVVEPFAHADLRAGLFEDSSVATLSGGRWAAVTRDDARRILLIDSQNTASPFRWINSPDEIASALVGWAGRLLVPGKSGPVHILDIANGSEAANPFHPRLQPGLQSAWHGTVLPAGNEVLLAESGRKLYRVGIRREPELHLAALATADLSAPLIAPPAIIGETAYVVDGQGQVVAFRLPDLVPAETWSLDGRLVWGPKRVGSAVLLASDRGELFCFGAEQQLRWKILLERGPLAGAPVEQDGSLILASRNGTVWRVSLESGEELGVVNVGEPLSSGALVVQGRLVIAAQDGTLLTTPLP